MLGDILKQQDHRVAPVLPEEGCEPTVVPRAPRSSKSTSAVPIALFSRLINLMLDQVDLPGTAGCRQAPGSGDSLGEMACL